jgi:hypothetical protein
MKKDILGISKEILSILCMTDFRVRVWIQTKKDIEKKQNTVFVWIVDPNYSRPAKSKQI